MLATQNRVQETERADGGPASGPGDSPLYLTSHTFIALTDGVLVFLDLRNDRYSCLERRHTKAVCAMLRLPASQNRAPDIDAACTPAELKTFIDDLLERNLATRDPKQGKQAALITQFDELEEMLGYMPGEGPGIRFRDVANFFRALIVTKWRLKFSSMERTVTHVKRRRERHEISGAASPDDERVNELVEIYKILKPLFVTVKDQCLFNSLFLIEFLACYRVYPNWYFGVRLNEFYAHCWVQGRNVIYDDFIHVTCDNQPIMVV